MNEEQLYPDDIIEAMCFNCHAFYETTCKEYEDSYTPLCGLCDPDYAGDYYASILGGYMECD